LELQESLIKFNKFLQENEVILFKTHTVFSNLTSNYILYSVNKTKKNRALKRTADERKQRELKESEIKKLELKLQEIALEEKALKSELEKNIKYQEYLESVVLNMSKFFPEISDILKRYNVLKSCNLDLIEKALSGEQLNEETLRDFMIYRKEKENSMLTDSNAISTLQVAYEQKLTSTSNLLVTIDNETKNATDKSVNLGQILTSVANILERADTSFRIRHNKPMIDHTLDTSENMSLNEKCYRAISKLEEISMFMGDYNDIHKEYIAENNKHSGGTKLNTSSVVISERSDISTTK